MLADGKHAVLQGTSMSCPHGTGAVALMLAKSGQLTPTAVRTNLQATAKTADQLTGTLPNNDWGYGKVDVSTMLALFSTCTTNQDCDDNKPCTIDTCIASGCVNTPGNSGTVCRAATGSCDAAETCDGTSDACPVDTLLPNGTTCEDGDACNGSETCQAGVCTAGTPMTCNDNSPCTVDSCSGGACVFSPGNVGATCRVSAGDCDVAETCDGTSSACPADAFVTSGIQCRASSGICDAAESCNGSSAACPADGFVAAGTQCRASAGDCDTAEACNGSSAACPADGFVAAGTQCRASAGDCDAAESCSGFTSSCPADAFKPATEVCRAAAGECDAAEACSGASISCSADLYAPVGTPCNSGSGACDGSGACVSSCSGDSGTVTSSQKKDFFTVGQHATGAVFTATLSCAAGAGNVDLHLQRCRYAQNPCTKWRNVKKSNGGTCAESISYTVPSKYNNRHFRWMVKYRSGAAADYCLTHTP